MAKPVKLRRGFKTRGGAQQSRNMSSASLKRIVDEKNKEFDEALTIKDKTKILQELRTASAAYVASLPDSADPDGSIEKAIMNRYTKQKTLLKKQRPDPREAQDNRPNRKRPDPREAK